MDQIRLDDVLGRATDVQWFEGIAVVQLICRTWRARGMSDSSFPGAADVILGPGGSVAVTGALPGHAVHAAAHLLARMLSEDVPVRLRLAVSQATATEAAYPSLDAFSEELRYFERPNLEGIVESVRQRALRAAPRAVAAVPSPVEAPAQPKRAPASSPPAARRRVGGWAVVAVIVSAAACAGVWAIGRAQIRASASQASLESAPLPAPGKGMKTQRGSHAATVSAPRISVLPPRSTEYAPHVLAAEIESTTDVLTLGQLASHSYPNRINLVDVAPGVVPAKLLVTETASTLDVDADADRIYTQRDANVTLPLNVYPKFPTQAAVPDASHRTVLELTIAKDGLVEEVKMLTAPRNIHEFMLLSAVKAWRFEPARVDGRAIRFRHTVTLDAASMRWVGSE
jgi:outer membrane biosynthesis protein TonB